MRRFALFQNYTLNFWINWNSAWQRKCARRNCLLVRSNAKRILAMNLIHICEKSRHIFLSNALSAWKIVLCASHSASQPTAKQFYQPTCKANSQSANQAPHTTHSIANKPCTQRAPRTEWHSTLASSLASRLARLVDTAVACYCKRAFFIFNTVHTSDGDVVIAAVAFGLAVPLPHRLLFTPTNSACSLHIPSNSTRLI